MESIIIRFWVQAYFRLLQTGNRVDLRIQLKFQDRIRQQNLCLDISFILDVTKQMTMM